MERKSRKKLYPWILILCIICALIVGSQMRKDPSGSREVIYSATIDSVAIDLDAETIVIDSAEDFLAICDPANYAAISVAEKKIVLAADIDMDGQEEIAPIGGGIAFDGVFDGQHHVIKNLSIFSTGNCTGLFGHVGPQGQIMNLGLDRVKVTGDINTGAFAGVLTGSVTECYVTGSITGRRYTGSIAGMLHAGTIENCWTDTALDGSYCCGGLFGGSDWDTQYEGNPPTPLTGPIMNKSMVIRNNLTLGTVTANRNAAGILGYMGDSKASPLEAFEGNVAWTKSITVRANDAYDYYDPVYAWWSVSRANPTISYNNLYLKRMNLNGADQPATLTTGENATRDTLRVFSATQEQLLTASTYSEDLNWDFETVWVWSDTLNHPVLKGFAVPEVYVQGEQKTPASVVTTFVDSPKTSRAFTWYTDTSIENTVIQAVAQENYTGEEDFAGENALRAEGTCYRLETAADGTSRNIHKVNLTGLMPGTTYCYRVGDGAHWCPVYTFTTEPEESDSFTFFNMTDTQLQYRSYANTLKYATENYPEAAFILHTGDAVEYNGTADYDITYSVTAKYTTNLPTMITPGNHELDKETIANPNYVKGLDNYKSHYQLPDNGPENGKQIIYSFEYGDAHFIILNSNNNRDSSITNGYPSDEELIEWMKADLASSDKAWNIVSIHHGPLNATADYNEVLAPALYELGIDLVLFGHDHVLLRSNPIIFNDTGMVFSTSTLDAQTGVHYAVAEGTVYYSSGCAGGSAYTHGCHAYFEVNANPPDDSTYGAITVTADTLTIRTHSVPNQHPDGEYILLDTFVLTKP